MKVPAGALKILAGNLWFWGVLAFLSALALALAAPWLLWRRRGRGTAGAAREGVWLYGRACLRLWRPAVKVYARPEWAPPGGPALVAVNHQSWLDIYLLAAQEIRDICFLVRAWPFRRLFFFSPLMRLAGYVETEGAGLEKTLARCREEAARGATLVAFPEGSRSRDGRLGRFHSGLFKLATDLNLPVHPLVISQSGRAMPKGSLLFRPAPIKLEWRPPLRPETFAYDVIPHGALRRATRRVFQQALAGDA